MGAEDLGAAQHPFSFWSTKSSLAVESFLELNLRSQCVKHKKIILGTGVRLGSLGL